MEPVARQTVDRRAGAQDPQFITWHVRISPAARRIPADLPHGELCHDLRHRAVDRRYRLQPRRLLRARRPAAARVLADRLGAKHVLVGGLFVQALAIATFLAVGHLGEFYALSSSSASPMAA
jgi:hypothetical protein